jgi:hypothetical protein
MRGFPLAPALLPARREEGSRLLCGYHRRVMLRMRAMSCGQVRLLIAGDPHTHFADVEENLVHCSECSKLHDASVAFEDLLLRALSLWDFPKIPGRSATRGGSALAAFPATDPSKSEPATSKQPRHWGVGIGLAAALVIGAPLWLAQPPATWAAQAQKACEAAEAKKN